MFHLLTLCQYITRDGIAEQSKMGKRKSSYMFPSLHQVVVETVSDVIASPYFHQDNSDSGVN
jgi:hypothetical protein